MKKSAVLWAILMILLAALTLAGCNSGERAEQEGEAPPAEKIHIKVAALKGPTGMGMAKLMTDSQSGQTANSYSFELSGAPDELVGKLTSGSVDIAALPANLAAVLYNKTVGKIQMAAVNTLGVLYVLENGDTVQSLSDLKGKTLAATGQGATPEFALNYILEQNGLTPGKDVTVKYLTEHAELAALAVSGKETLVMLPEPFATTVLTKKTEFRQALDLTKEWQAAETKGGQPGSQLVMGCLVVRREFAEQHKEALDAFLSEYRASAQFVNENPAEAASMIVSQGILPDAALAQKAIPGSSIVFMEGGEMTAAVQPFLEVLLKGDAKSVGGKMPGDDFYYQR